MYKSGFATSEEAYQKNVTTLFKSLDRVEEYLSKATGPYYHGEQPTEADIRLFTVSDILSMKKIMYNIRHLTIEYPDHRSIRPRLCPTFQMQHPRHSIRISGDPPLAAPPVLEKPGLWRDDRIHAHSQSLHQIAQADQPVLHHAPRSSTQHPETRRGGRIGANRVGAEVSRSFSILHQIRIRNLCFHISNPIKQ